MTVPHTENPIAPAAAPLAVLAPADAAGALPPAVQAAFLEALSQWGNVRAAAQQAGVSRAHCYRLRRASAPFRELWDAALLIARPQVEEVLADRALNGVTEAVFYHGEEVATRTRFDARLLLAHLGRLDRLEATFAIKRAGQEFDERLEQLRNPALFDAWDDADDDDADEDADDDFDWDGALASDDSAFGDDAA
ncbi:hypothetical protein [Erythrobacter sp. R86502]|uniref:hypothetical protein n=1 Tax=Erythrobacter sp. R86502 TaxID=3093846 RepID=UPI0036D3EB1A